MIITAEVKHTKSCIKCFVSDIEIDSIATEELKKQFKE